ncbi:MAG: transcription antitermination factor NusB [Nitrospinaceae bacterium]|jgi:N utilization substance protein B|nr:transcription antitermination factor NusB [Nitrospinaceae bacterium]|tara:strand:+ start:629 stop:1060 length:432 start_codon:yes stop_codon:yes gene_type:complete
MGKRRIARELALKFLYQSEFNPDELQTQIAQFCERSGTQAEIIEFMRALVEKVFAHAEEIDVLLNKFSDHWALERMSMVDRNILRLGICELAFTTATPPKVAINEAVEIAKKFGTEDSPDFINGILDKVFKETLKDTSSPTAK